MKLKNLFLAAIPLAATVTTLPIITSCQNNNTKVLTYTKAKEWVKNNFSAEAKQYEITKSESNWSFGGFVTNYGASYKEAGTRVDWLYNHLDNLIIQFADIATTSAKKDTVSLTEVDRAGAIGSGESKGYCKLGDIAFSSTLLEDEKLVVENDDLSHEKLETLTAENFDKIIGTYFFGFYKNNADYIVDEKNKTITAYGTFSYIGKEDQGTHNLKLPNLKVTFNSEGKLVKCAFVYNTISNGTYMWQGTTSSDGYSFAILEGSYLNFNYTTKDAE